LITIRTSKEIVRERWEKRPNFQKAMGCQEAKLSKQVFATFILEYVTK